MLPGDSPELLSAISTIESMGYNETQARAALTATDNNLERLAHKDSLTHTNMYTYMYTHTHIHTHTHTHTHINTHTRTHTDRQTDRQTHTQTHTHINTHTLTYTHRQTDRHTHTQTHTYIYTHALSYTHSLIHTLSHTHTHKHTHTRTRTHSYNSEILHSTLIFSLSLYLSAYPSEFFGPTGPEASQAQAFTFLVRDQRLGANIASAQEIGRAHV